MKNYILIFILCLLFCETTFSQMNAGFEYAGRFGPAIKQEKVNEARIISDIMPEFCRYFTLPTKERYKFEQLLKLEDFIPRNYSYSQKYFYHQEKFERLIDYISIEILAICKGKSVSAKSKTNVLTSEQKNILNAADPGTDLKIKVAFKYKYPTPEFPGTYDALNEGTYVVTVVPNNEAEYPGGFKQLSAYLNKIFINKLSKNMLNEKLQNAIVKFTITEEGKIIDTKMSRTSLDAKIDALLIDAINKMPIWKPAENIKGIKVKQQYTIPLSGGGC